MSNQAEMPQSSPEQPAEAVVEEQMPDAPTSAEPELTVAEEEGAADPIEPAVVTDAAGAQPEEDSDEGEELPLATLDESVMALSERFNTRVELEDGLRHAESEMLFLREQIRDEPSVAAVVQEQQNRLEYIASTTFALTEKLADLSTSVGALSLQLEKVSDETERMVAWSASTKITSALSRTFLVLASIALVALLGGMGYLGFNHLQLQQRQDAVSRLVAQSVEAQSKRQAEFDKQFATLVGAEIKQERELISKESVQSKLNRIRNGAAEVRLLRRHTGDWLLPRGKVEEQLTDHDLIEHLNQLFEKSGKSLTTPPSIPPHKVVTLLKPNGKGGTELQVTKEVMQ